MAVNLRSPESERYDVEPDHEPSPGVRLGSALSDWDRSDWDHEDAARNPAGMAGPMSQAGGNLRRWIRGGFGVLALAGFVAVLWYAYEWGLGGGETVYLPTVRAEAGPEKEKPSDPGGLRVPYQDQLVLNQSGSDASAPRVERLLPPPEAPLPALSEIAPSYDEPVDEPPLEGEALPDAGQSETLQPAGEPPATAPAAETVPQVPAASGDQPAAAVAPPADPPAAEPESAASEPTPTQNAAAQPTAPEPTAPEPVAQVPATQVPAAQAAGKFAVQLVSLKDRGAAEAEWRRLQGVFPGLLGDKSLLLQSAEVAGVGTVYRLRTGPFASRNDAAQICAQLKSKQQDCLVVSR